MGSNMPDWHDELHSAMELLERGEAEKCISSLHMMLEDHGRDPFCRALVQDGMGRALFMDEQAMLGIEAFNESLAILRQLYSEQKISASMLLGSLQNLAHAQMITGNLDESLKVGKEAVALAEKTSSSQSPDVARALFTLSAPYYEMKDYDSAEACLLRAKKILEDLPGDPDQQIGTILNNLGRLYEERGELEHGIDYHRRAVDFRRKLPNREDLAFSLGNYGVALGSAGKLRPAREALEECVKIYKGLNLGNSPVARAFATNLELFRNAGSPTNGE